MEDKEVGKLWKEICETPTDTFAFQDEIIAVIRKLVEEREKYYIQADRKNSDALRDFGIDLTTWK